MDLQGTVGYREVINFIQNILERSRQAQMISSCSTSMSQGKISTI